MNQLETVMKPLILDLLQLIERAQAIACCPEVAIVDPAEIERSRLLIRSAMETLPLPEAELAAATELDSVPPAMPAAEPDSEPTSDWLLGDEDSF